MTMHANVTIALVETDPDGNRPPFTVVEYAHAEAVPGTDDRQVNGITAAAVLDRVIGEGRDSIAVQMRGAIGEATDDDLKYTRRRPTTHRG